MTVYGGYYKEECLLPQWNNYFGSAGRAVAILSNLNNDIIFETYVSKELNKHIKYFGDFYNIKLKLHENKFNIGFSYFHSLSNPKVLSNKNYHIEKNNLINIVDENVICYGTLESQPPIIKAKKCVFDFQSSSFDEVYNSNNKIDEICLILNFKEASQVSENINIKNIKEYFFNILPSLEILIIKDGPFGGNVFMKENHNIQIPIFKTDKLFKIGTGDIFTAIFGYLWIKQDIYKYSLEQITEISSFSVAYFAQNFSNYKVNILERYKNKYFEKAYINTYNISKKVYLAGPFFNTAQRWQLEDIKQLLGNFKFDVFSPLHDVGTSQDSQQIASLDLNHPIKNSLNE